MLASALGIAFQRPWTSETGGAEVASWLLYTLGPIVAIAIVAFVVCLANAPFRLDLEIRDQLRETSARLEAAEDALGAGPSLEGQLREALKRGLKIVAAIRTHVAEDNRDVPADHFGEEAWREETQAILFERMTEEVDQLDRERTRMFFNYTQRTESEALLDEFETYTGRLTGLIRRLADRQEDERDSAW